MVITYNVEMDWLPLYPFGFGLSFTSFEYSNIRLSKTEIYATETVDVLFDVTNEDGKFEVTVGNNSSNILLTTEINVLPL